MYRAQTGIDNTGFRLMDCFPGSFINSEGELVLIQKINLFIQIADKSRTELIATLLEYCSRDVNHSRTYGQRIMTGINNFIGKDFSKSDYEIIYRYLGNGINHEMTFGFIKENCNIGFLDGVPSQMSLEV